MATFGNTTIETDGNWEIYDSWISACKYTLTEAGTITKITAYLEAVGGSPQVMRAVIYDDDGAGGDFGTLKGTSAEVNIPTDYAAAWTDFTFSTPVVLAAGDWWLCIHGGPTSQKTYLRRKASGNTMKEVSDSYADGARATQNASEGSYSRNPSLYATYTTGDPPTLSTVAISDITADSFASGGYITADGGAELTDYGICWNTTGTPTVADDHTHDKP